MFVSNLLKGFGKCIHTFMLMASPIRLAKSISEISFKKRSLLKLEKSLWMRDSFVIENFKFVSNSAQHQKVVRNTG